MKEPSADADEFKNYRPFSNLPQISKIIEKVVIARLHTHMSENLLNSIHRSAYRRHYSTETALSKTIKDFLCVVDNN